MLGVVLEALGGGLRGTLAPKVSQDSKSEANIGSLAALGSPRGDNCWFICGSKVRKCEKKCPKTDLELGPKKVSKIGDFVDLQDLPNQAGTAAGAPISNMH